jgi:hypothetical protein
VGASAVIPLMDDCLSPSAVAAAECVVVGRVKSAAQLIGSTGGRVMSLASVAGSTAHVAGSLGVTARRDCVLVLVIMLHLD